MNKHLLPILSIAAAALIHGGCKTMQKSPETDLLSNDEHKPNEVGQYQCASTTYFINGTRNDAFKQSLIIKSIDQDSATGSVTIVSSKDDKQILSGRFNLKRDPSYSPRTLIGYIRYGTNLIIEGSLAGQSGEAATTGKARYEMKVDGKTVSTELTCSRPEAPSATTPGAKLTCKKLQKATKSNQILPKPWSSDDAHFLALLKATVLIHNSDNLTAKDTKNLKDAKDLQEVAKIDGLDDLEPAANDVDISGAKYQLMSIGLGGNSFWSVFSYGTTQHAGFDISDGSVYFGSEFCELSESEEYDLYKAFIDRK